MTVPDKKLRDGEVRFEVRKIDKLWRVYDRVRGSFPYHNKDLGGAVVQDVPEKEAQVEVDRLNEKFVEKAKPISEMAEKKKSSPKKKQAAAEPVALSEQEQEVVAEWISEEDIPDYGLMDEETAKKYTEGIL